MLRRAVYGEPFAVSRGTAQHAAHTALTPLDPVTELAHQAAPLFLLAFFAEDALAGIFDALALVRLRGPVLANLGCDLADLMPVATGDDNLNRSRRGDRDPLRDRVHDVVAIAERKMQIFALHRGTITDAVDFQALLEPLGDARNEIGHQRARGAPLGPRALGLGARLDLDLAAFELDRDVIVQRHLQGAFRPFDLYSLAFDIGSHARRHRDCSFADTRHQ